MDDYQKFIAYSRYSRWLEDKKRRESWPEIVARYIDWMMIQTQGAGLNSSQWIEIEKAITDLEVMPSMRCLMTAGPALDRTHVAGYNCAYLAIDNLRAFDEAMYILMCGTGVGFSVENKYVSKLPVIEQLVDANQPIVVVRDSKEGWASALRNFIDYLFKGYVPGWDTSRVRPAGARLKTFGGRASGPGPLKELFTYISEIIGRARGRQLTSLECHDIMCKIAEVVVVGGVRRSAMISLSDVNNDQMRYAKHGAWYDDNSQRALANNSAVYVGERPSTGEFIREWQSLYDSKSGERGIFNRRASVEQAARNGRRDINWDFGTNPCSEIILRSNQFCNLTEVVVRPGDNLAELGRKVRLATILGTFQSTLTNFKYLRNCWRKNTEEERLLGVSFTGLLDHPELVHNAQWLTHLKNVAIETNKEFATRLGINVSTAITCVKPSGTVSQLVDSASGIHPRHSEYYIRTVRGDRKDPITQFMIDQGIPNEPDFHKPDDTVVFSFPRCSPTGSVTRETISAIEHLEIWSRVQEYWCEHKPSVTINVREHEWMGVGAWVFDNFDTISGVSFLPYSEHTYRQAPYQECTKEEYESSLAKMPKSIDWSKLSEYEKEDTTTGSQEYACAAGFCEII